MVVTDRAGIRVVHVSTHDGGGGAAIAARRVHDGLRGCGVDSRMLVRIKSTRDPSIVQFEPSSRSWPARSVRRLVQRSRHWPYLSTRPADFEIFTDAQSRYGADVAAAVSDADVVHLHWVATFVNYGLFFPALAPRQRVFWTLHDMAPFTGGCHYASGCEGFLRACGSCPILGSRKETDLSRRTWERKQRALSRIDDRQLVVVTPSHWLAGEARRSSLFGRFEVRVIPYGLDLDVFRPIAKPDARERLGLPRDASVLLFVADSLDNPRKGMAHLLAALDELPAGVAPLLLTLGSGHGDMGSPLRHVHLGKLTAEDEVAAAYSAADLFVIPTLDDNLPNTVLEALACGTPVVAFASGGVPEMIEDGITGALVPRGDASALSARIAQLLHDRATLTAMSAAAPRRAAKNHDLCGQARKYADAYSAAIL